MKSWLTVEDWCWEGFGAGGEGDNRGWDGWMASLTRSTWLWVNSGSWGWTGRPGVLWFMGSQRVGHDWVTELNWTYFELLFVHDELRVVVHSFSDWISSQVELPLCWPNTWGLGPRGEHFSVSAPPPAFGRPCTLVSLKGAFSMLHWTTLSLDILCKIYEGNRRFLISASPSALGRSCTPESQD